MPPVLSIFTSAAANYEDKVRLLAASVKRHEPDARFTWLCVEPREAAPTHPVPGVDQIVAAEDVDAPDFQRWMFRHTIVEACTGVKPFFLRQALKRGDADRHVYLDPDTVLFAPLDPIWEEIGDGAAGLTPHQLAPEQTERDVINNEICSMRHGLYNLGFLAVRACEEGSALIDWWADRMVDHCRVDYAGGVFVDQKWMDFAPIFFSGVKILRHPGLNVAPWNLTTRAVERVGDAVRVNGRPLIFYHFTGFDSGDHDVMAQLNSQRNPDVLALVQAYRDQLAGISVERRPWAFGRYENGVLIEPRHREIYRRRRDLQEAFPNPFAVDGGRSYLGWLMERWFIEYPEDAALYGGEAARASDRASPPQRLARFAARAVTRLVSRPSSTG